MSNLRTSADVIEDALRKAGEKTDGTSDYNSDALSYLNTHYRAIISGGNYFDVDLGDPWTWAKAKYPGVLTLLPPYATGTVTVTEDSATGSFSVAPAASQLGRMLKVTGVYEFYRITAHTAGATAFTLDSPFNDSSQTSPFQSIQLDYDLALSGSDKILRLFAPLTVYRTQTSDADFEGKIVGLDVRSFSKKYPMYKLTSGTPTEFAPISFVDGLYTVRFNKWVTQNTRVEFDHIPEPADLTNDATSIPVLPSGHRECLSITTAYSILKDKKDSEAGHFFSLSQQALKALANANEREFLQISKNRGRLVARGDDYGIRNWPTSGDLNS